MPTSLALAMLVTGTAFAAAGVAISGVTAIHDLRRRKRGAAPSGGSAVFLFDDRALIDANAPARALLRTLPPGSGDWQRLTVYLQRRFPGFAGLAEVGALPKGAAFLADDGCRLELSGGPRQPARVALDWNGEGAAGVAPDPLCQRAQEEEITRLRQMGEALHLPVWATGPEGAVTWANAAYLAQVAEVMGGGIEDLSWPLPNLLDRLGAPERGAGARPLPSRSGQAARWFLVDSSEFDGGQLHVATPADALVRAQTTRDEVMQTLTKAFAELPIGLAVFDRQRQLTLFNPALTELTGVGPQFMVARPTLCAFLDRLREARMIPEPRDYHGWRQAIADIERAASAGTYDDTWNLPSGVTYRVSTRPHPDGALALWFEDVSADVKMTRRFRSEIQTCQEVVEELGIAVAVFSPAGHLTLSNSAFARLWHNDADARIAAVGIADLAPAWQAMTEPTPVSADLVHFVHDSAGHRSWQGAVHLLDGGAIRVRAARLGGGSTMVEFRAVDGPVAADAPDIDDRALAPA